MKEKAPLLEARGICKRFPGVRALHQVHLRAFAGRVVALLGENGAGKSTLMKILAGVIQPDAGSIFLDGVPARISSVRVAESLGIALIHQELNLAGNLDVAGNIFLGREANCWGILDRRTMDARCRELLRAVGLGVSPRATLGSLPIGQQQLVEIAKALSLRARLLIMDEPTSSLSAREAEILFGVVRQLRASGVGILYISHRLGEVEELADRVVVLRDGENAGDLERDLIQRDRMVRLMVGRDVSQFYARQPHRVGAPVLEVRDLVTRAHPEHAVSFELDKGEIVAVAGLVGAGRTEVLQTLFGIDPALRGAILVAGRAVRLGTPADAIRAGMALVPEDRKQAGLLLEMTVRQNVSLAALGRRSHAAGLLNLRDERVTTADMIQRLNIKTPDARQTVRLLSGGNQQKVVLAKWLAMQPKILLLDEPTRGIDVGAKEEIYRLMEQLAASGVTVLFVSSELEEILGMADRVLVMHEGRLAGQLAREELTEQAVMCLATGASKP
jgi:ribose transport system ATP-binding protein